MFLKKELKKSINKSVLCWLATSNNQDIPNVSPKEIFTYFKKDRIIIANIASPHSVKNIKMNPNVCVSFIDILVQKGYQLKGKGRIIDQSDKKFDEMSLPLLELTKGKFPFYSIIEVKIDQVKPILAPSYVFYPNTSEQEQIEKAKNTYGF